MNTMFRRSVADEKNVIERRNGRGSAVESGERPTQVADRLLRALLVLDEGEPDEPLTTGPESDAG